MGLFGHTGLHDNGTHRSVESTDIPRNPPTFANPTSTTTEDHHSALFDLSCSHCDRKFTSRIGLTGHLRIHRPETNEPVPAAPAYNRNTRFHCP
ncbi:unnamed protein product [Schistocephalus solidus]|uniref:C2H2-type domain-containing protein n=1 Tax=Schistocephalus solidus TaxID=70667 RepID=A0A183SX94_SCHSO|nr:unnamed protein product [Schistocephalus solidus]